jgi:hypothetical protein
MTAKLRDVVEIVVPYLVLFLATGGVAYALTMTGI